MCGENTSALTSSDTRKQDVCLGLGIFMNTAIIWQAKKIDALNCQFPNSWQKASTTLT